MISLEYALAYLGGNTVWFFSFCLLSFVLTNDSLRRAIFFFSSYSIEILKVEAVDWLLRLALMLISWIMIFKA